MVIGAVAALLLAALGAGLAAAALLIGLPTEQRVSAAAVMALLASLLGLLARAPPLYSLLRR